MEASYAGHTEIVKMLLKQDRIEINPKEDVYFISSKSQTIILCFKIINGV